MLLKSLEIQGFKTFPDRKKLIFDKGITSIVGPNGSGKSNISDAIRWVLGEQSAKTLRCSKMEDVVFNGTNSRKRLGYAEVTLTFDNSDRILQFNGDEVSVTRRYYRSGESEYLINKATVRLRDINELFMDTGLGRDGYSMIGQGKIDSIVASKSDERREIFEEAAGISRYRYRKTESERKLKNTEDNLVRLRDIVGELTDRVGPLKNQSEKAQEFLSFSDEKKGLEIALWLETLNKSANVLKEQEEKIAVQNAQYEDSDRELESISKETEEIYLKNSYISSQIDSYRREISVYETNHANTKSLISVEKNNIEHNNESIERLANEITVVDSNREVIEKEIEDKKTRIKDIEDKIQTLQSKYNENADVLNNINVDASRKNDELQALTSELSVLSTSLAEVKVITITSESTVTDLNTRLTTLKENLNEKESSLEDLEKMATDYEAKGNEIAEECNSTSNTINGLEMRLSSRLKKKEELKDQVDKLLLDSNEMTRRAKILSDLEKNLEGFSRSVKVVMDMSQKHELGGIHGPVSRLISVPKEYSVAIEIALGNAMQNIITRNEEDAKRAIALLKKNNGGRSTFLPLNIIKPRALKENGLDDCYGFIGIASDLVSCNAEYDNIISNLLGRIVIADDINSAVSIAKKYGYKFKVVTLDGQVVNAGGSLTGGSFNKTSGLLSRSSDIEKFRQKADEYKKLSDEKNKEFAIAQAEYAKCEADILGYRADLSKLQQDLITMQMELKACTNEIDSTNNDIKSINEEILASNNKILSISKDKEEAEKKIVELKDKIKVAEDRSSEITGNRLSLSTKREELSTILQNLRLDIVASEKDVESLNSEINLSLNSTMNQDSKKKELAFQIENVNALNAESNSKIEEYESLITSITASIDSINSKIEELNSDKDNSDKRSVLLRNKEKELLSTKELSGRELSRLEERKISIQSQYDSIISKLWEDYQLTKSEAENEAVEIENISTAQKRLSELKQRIKSLGSVNVGAIEEYKEVKERYDFMTKQVGDVEKAKSEIEKLISQLTTQMKEAFVDNFEKINKNFGETFKEMFGGGEASLELTDADDILNSGIDIKAHPPGKIVVHLEALSGGEKALVAIALYFAIMKVRPAPFCIMDEIEAALDEVNVDRFAQYLRRMTDRTQFILITHRRGTMDEADVLYGVTMQDEGVSKLLELRSSEIALQLGIKSN